MIQRLILLLLGLAALVAARADAPRVIPLWPEGVPGLRSDAAEEKIVNNRVVGVHYPSLTVYAPPAEKNRGTAVIFCPGGGYVKLALGEHGGCETQFLNDAGVTVFLLKYRLVEYGHPAPLRDILCAIRLVRSRAAEFGMKPERIGLLGESAGGHLAACAAVLWDDPDGRTAGELDAAVLQFREALQLDPASAPAQYALGRALSRNGGLTEAVTRLREAVRLQPDFVDAHFELALALQSLGQTEEANQHFLEAKRLGSARLP
jgi:acetyl esterase/lipase